MLLITYLCEFISEAAEISRVMSNSCAKERSIVSSSEKGKAKVFDGNKKTTEKEE